jgi:hypothetical protein
MSIKQIWSVSGSFEAEKHLNSLSLFSDMFVRSKLKFCALVVCG